MLFAAIAQMRAVFLLALLVEKTYGCGVTRAISMPLDLVILKAFCALNPDPLALSQTGKTL